MLKAKYQQQLILIPYLNNLYSIPHVHDMFHIVLNIKATENQSSARVYKHQVHYKCDSYNSFFL